MSGDSAFDLYEGYCLNDVYATIFNVNYVSLSAFDITIFQISTSQTLSFYCDVRMFLNGAMVNGIAQELPICPATEATTETILVGRKRREYTPAVFTDKVPTGTFYI